VTLHQREYAQARGEERPKAAESVIGAYRDLAQAQEDAGDADAAIASLRQALILAGSIRAESRPALQTQLADLVGRTQTARQLASLKAKLEASPQNLALRKELVRTCLVDLDDPAQAAAFVDDSLDPPARKYVPAAARGVEAAPELACLELADWYRGLVLEARTSAAKAAVLGRARDYYTRFLALHTIQDAARAAAAQALKKVEDDLATLGPAARPGRRRLLVMTLARSNFHRSTAVAARLIQETGQKTQSYDTTVRDDAGAFSPTVLMPFDAVCLVNCNGELADASGLKALLDFVRNGKGLAAIHSAAAAFTRSPDYADMLGAGFGGSPFGRVSVKIDDPFSPLVASFGGKGFELRDELYSFRDPYSREKLHILLSVDAENSGPYLGRRTERQDADYAVSWIKTYGQGRVFYTALAHDEAAYSDPAIAGHILAGVRFALGLLAADTTPSARLAAVRPVRGPPLSRQQ